jgi:uncharacterized protein YbjT (DUF2867 family)
LGSIRFPNSLAPMIGALPEATFTFARDRWHTEEHIRASRLRHTFLRDNMYLEFLPTLARTDGVLRGPAKGASGRWRAMK